MGIDPSWRDYRSAGFATGFEPKPSFSCLVSVRKPGPCHGSFGRSNRAYASVANKYCMPLLWLDTDGLSLLMHRDCLCAACHLAGSCSQQIGSNRQAGREAGRQGGRQLSGQPLELETWTERTASSMVGQAPEVSWRSRCCIRRLGATQRILSCLTQFPHMPNHTCRATTGIDDYKTPKAYPTRLLVSMFRQRPNPKILMNPRSYRERLVWQYSHTAPHYYYHSSCC